MTLRDELRRTPALTGTPPELDLDTLGDDPVTVFADWYRQAARAGVSEPHAMTVATADASGAPSSRVVVLKDLTARGWWFATDARSTKARDLAANPAVALGFWWPGVCRQVRVQGRAVLASAAESAADYLARSPASRAAALGTHPGEELTSPAELGATMARARERIDADPGYVLPQWQAWCVEPELVELWQGSSDRAHLRIVFLRRADGWSRTLVWP